TAPGRRSKQRLTCENIRCNSLELRRFVPKCAHSVLTDEIDRLPQNEEGPRTCSNRPRGDGRPSPGVRRIFAHYARSALRRWRADLNLGVHRSQFECADAAVYTTGYVATVTVGVRWAEASRAADASRRLNRRTPGTATHNDTEQRVRECRHQHYPHSRCYP